MLCALVLHVARQLELEKCSSANGELCTVGDVRTVFFLMDKEYPEMLAFMRDFAQRFQLNVIELKCGFKEGLSELVSETGSNTCLPMKAMFTGTRRDDPNGRNQKAFCPTDPSWPALMRVNPILEFEYHDIWTFLRLFHLPYCAMYDHGYTSIGTMDDTTTNEGLWSHLLGGYLPPWRLQYGHHERLGRGLRRFLSHPAHPNLLAYPSDILMIITSMVGFRDLTRLHAAGDKNFNKRLIQGVHRVRFNDRYAVGPQERKRVTLGLESKFGEVQSLELDFSMSFEADGVFNKLTNVELDFTRELPKSLQHLALTRPCSAIPAPSASTPRSMSESTEISPQNHGTLQAESAINLPNLKSLCITHPQQVAPFSLNRIQCPMLVSLEASDFPLDLDWLSTLSKLESLTFSYRPSNRPLPLPATLKSLNLKYSTLEDVKALQKMPAGLTSLQLKVSSSIIEPFLESLPRGLLHLRISVGDTYSMSWTRAWLSLPPGLLTLRLETPLFNSPWGAPPPSDSGPHSSLFTQWIESLPPTLQTLRINAQDFLEVAWSTSSAVRDLTLENVLSLPRALPSELKSFRVLMGMALKQSTILNSTSTFALPSTLTRLSGFGIDFQQLPDLPDTLLRLECTSFWGETKEAQRERSGLVRKLPKSLRSLTLMFSHVTPNIIGTFPNSLRELTLQQEVAFGDEMIELLPRSLHSLFVYSNSAKTYGEGLKHLPPYLAVLSIPNARLSIEIEELKREILPPTLTDVFLGPLRFLMLV